MKKKNIALVISLLIIATFALLTKNCDTFFMYIFYKVGISKPVLENITIEMNKGWYPGLSSERGVGKIVSEQKNIPDDRSTIWFFKIDGCAIVDQLTIYRFSPEQIKNYEDDFDIEISKKLTWGVADILDIDLPPQDNIAREVILISEYNLLLVTANIETLDEIIDLKIEKNGN